MKRLTNLLLCIFLLFAYDAIAQAPKKLNAAEIKQALNKLEVLGTAMYLAAHPDDENTRMIAYLANERNLRTAYLAMTRGDGGQNLIGTEIREYLGIIRTQELLAARRRDGGEQYFTRANDFGFSKDPDETLKIWDEEQVFADVIWNIRKFRPDVIITRFDTARVPGGRMHGHHTASALLAQRAFDAANDPNVFPEQLKWVDPWQPIGLYWNTYNFRGNSTEDRTGQKEYFPVNLGEYNELLGKSYDEISAISRSQHKSQGFGSTGRRGNLGEYFRHWKGELPKQDILEAVDLTWTRVEGGQAIGALISRANDNYDLENPSAIIGDLMEARELISNISDEYWKNVKLKELDLIIKSVLGLYLEVVARDFSGVAGETIEYSVEAINRSNANVKLLDVEFLDYDISKVFGKELPFNIRVQESGQLTLKGEDSQPYWLVDEAALGMYRVDDQSLRGLPENPAAISAHFNLMIEGKPYTWKTDLVFKRNDRVDGEVYRPFVITPQVFVNIEQPVSIFADGESKVVDVVVKSGKDNVTGSLNIDLPEGWRSDINNLPISLKTKGEEKRIRVNVLPPANASEGQVKASFNIGGQVYDRGLKIIDYKHIPIQTIFPKAEAKVVKLELQKKGQYIGYIMGSGDAIPQSLEQVGYTVDILDPNSITDEASLANYDAVIVGIRAYNTQERMRFIQPWLMEYVQKGGTVIAQYNTSMRNNMELGPYPFSISRDRVTVEEAEVRILAPDHPLIDGPNKITSKDFEGWVQERGLYFPNQWDERYTPILSSNDPGETPKNGGLLVAQYGQGYYVYTGYSWFRELPAGVAGAFRIFTNMISLGQDQPNPTKLQSIENKN